MIDYISAIVNGMWNALESYPDWANLVAEKNRLKFVTTEPTKLAQLQTTTTDLPKCWIIPTSGYDSLYSQPENETFSEYDDDTFVQGQTEFLQNLMVELTITIDGKTLKLGQSDPVLINTLAAIRQKGPRLGMPDLVNYVGRCNWTMKETDRNEAKGVTRFLTTVRVQIYLQKEGNAF